MELERQIHDFGDLTKYPRDLAGAIMGQQSPLANIVLIGESIDYKQMKQLGEVSPESYAGCDIKCHILYPTCTGSVD